MFMWYEGNSLIGHLVSHVDDFVYAGLDSWIESTINKIKELALDPDRINQLKSALSHSINYKI